MSISGILQGQEEGIYIEHGRNNFNTTANMIGIYKTGTLHQEKTLL